MGSLTSKWGQWDRTAPQEGRSKERRKGRGRYWRILTCYKEDDEKNTHTYSTHEKSGSWVFQNISTLLSLKGNHCIDVTRKQTPEVIESNRVRWEKVTTLPQERSWKNMYGSVLTYHSLEAIREFFHIVCCTHLLTFTSIQITSSLSRKWNLIRIIDISQYNLSGREWATS